MKNKKKINYIKYNILYFYKNYKINNQKKKKFL